MPRHTRTCERTPDAAGAQAATADAAAAAMDAGASAAALPAVAVAAAVCDASCRRHIRVEWAPQRGAKPQGRTTEIARQQVL
jgi:hypothetical protein